MRFGKIYEGTVVEVEEPLPGQTIEDAVGDTAAEEYVAIPDGVDVGHSQNMSGGWDAPKQTVH